MAAPSHTLSSNNSNLLTNHQFKLDPKYNFNYILLFEQK